MGQQEKEFDRSVCFSFFEDYCQHVENVEKEFGIETAYKVIMAIVKYGLYEEEPEDSKMKILVNKTILKSIDLSQKRRSRGFSGEDLEKTQKVIDYYHDHPDASQNEIAKATGISKGKVNKVIRKIKEEELNNSNSISISSSNASSNSSMTVTVTGSTESHTEDALLKDADALEELNFNSSLSVFSDDDIKRIMKATYNEKKDLYDNNELIKYLIKEFTGNNYKCENKQAVSDYANYIVYNDITE